MAVGCGGTLEAKVLTRGRARTALGRLPEKRWCVTVGGRQVADEGDRQAGEASVARTADEL